ncbi:ergothioneine biosynthesis protein EgtB [Mitsuaria sp. GD03876]|uniref:ergothioneine biosynthesis protein EgtB n=1 Tax=Mitsuaria sp. GD03876 TaxID=2975399 RepID=UPI002447F0AD|nr:ergothioneine biosynthesis protein EgtB [Mitsuaria sp. GD03876]MDH0866724.1 ergothioneine biosynthesis protein EgtB [Mitsuaria sp. GD03876]
MSDHDLPPERRDLARRYEAVRRHTLTLAEPLSAEDQAAQSMPDASPAKWHQAHTSWFFEALLLRPHLPGYRPLDESHHYLFNSYYEGLGPRHPRPQRGLLTRPSLDEVRAYRRHVDAHIQQLIAGCDDATWAAIAPTLELGLHHEQQHQELLLTDALHLLSCHPWRPALRDTAPVPAVAHASEWLRHDGGLVDIGHDASAAGAGFAFDNEGPRHRAWLEPFEIASHLVTCGEFQRFIDNGGYRDPRWWLSDAWATVQSQGWRAPPYWVDASDGEGDGQGGAPSRWSVFGLHGLRAMDPSAPVMQLSFYEAAAYAEWAGARLPSEQEWEAAAALPGIAQLDDQAWQWTRSAYHPYPGFRPLEGVASEYNGKFMVGQLVLRGGSLATPPGHARPTYRNFFPPAARWQFTGLRLARDARPRAETPA